MSAIAPWWGWLALGLVPGWLGLNVLIVIVRVWRPLEPKRSRPERSIAPVHVREVPCASRPIAARRLREREPEGVRR